MKKVRYMIGAAGALAVTPVLGALTPAANAATAHTAAAPSGKTVSLNHSTTPAAVACLAQSVKRAHSGTGVNKFSVTAAGVFDQLTPCLGFTAASLAHAQVGLKLRVRTYYKGVQKSWGFQGGREIDHNTVFSKTTNALQVTKVCDALVYASTTGDVAYGPVCINL